MCQAADGSHDHLLAEVRASRRRAGKAMYLRTMARGVLHAHELTKARSGAAYVSAVGVVAERGLAMARTALDGEQDSFQDHLVASQDHSPAEQHDWEEGDTDPQHLTLWTCRRCTARARIDFPPPKGPCPGLVKPADTHDHLRKHPFEPGLEAEHCDVCGLLEKTGPGYVVHQLPAVFAEWMRDSPVYKSQRVQVVFNAEPGVAYDVVVREAGSHRKVGEQQLISPVSGFRDKPTAVTSALPDGGKLEPDVGAENDKPEEVVSFVELVNWVSGLDAIVEDGDVAYSPAEDRLYQRQDGVVRPMPRLGSGS